jgi:hypothetical protein
MKSTPSWRTLSAGTEKPVDDNRIRTTYFASSMVERN